MNAQNDGGPAFPMPGMTGLPNGEFIYGENGMSLRDYFAAKAMHAELSTSGMHEESAKALMVAARRAGRTPEKQIAFNAYELADAMLAERSKS